MKRSVGEMKQTVGETKRFVGEMKQIWWGDEATWWGNEAKCVGEMPHRQSEITPSHHSITAPQHHSIKSHHRWLPSHLRQHSWRRQLQVRFTLQFVCHLISSIKWAQADHNCQHDQTATKLCQLPIVHNCLVIFHIPSHFWHQQLWMSQHQLQCYLPVRDSLEWRSAAGKIGHPTSATSAKE